MARALAAQPRIARLTVEQVHAMLEAGILRDAEPVELLDGVLIHKDRSAVGEDPLTIGRRHNAAVQLLGVVSAELAARGCFIQLQGPLSLPPHDEPEPDGVVLRGEPRDYADRLPGAEDVACVVEVADSSLGVDRTRKLALYARVGIAQYIIVNLHDPCLEVHEDPSPASGSYRTTAVRRRGETVALCLPGGSRLELPAERLLP